MARAAKTLAFALGLAAPHGADKGLGDGAWRTASVDNLGRRRGLVHGRGVTRQVTLGSEPVRTFDIYLEDDRSALPILSFVEAADLAGAREHATRLLAQSSHHRAVAIREGYHALCIVAREDD